jgi:uncharacterized protein (DUF2252 family)
VSATDPPGAASVDDRRAAGRRLRKTVPRSGHGAWKPGPRRKDPISLLRKQDRVRLGELVPIRYGRMAASPLAFLRGSAVVMAADLATTPVSGLRVQACGDAHLSNFGVFATPERHLVFDLNDFDETLPAPFEWDVKRLAASIVVAGRCAPFSEADCRAAAHTCAYAYRQKMAEYAGMGALEVWYSRIDVDTLLELQDRATRRRSEKRVRRAQRRTSLGALDRFTRVIDGRRVIVDHPPLIEHVEFERDRTAAGIPDVYRQYKASLPEERRTLLDRYRFVDAARKVVGVGSVGTRAYMVLLDGVGERDPLFLQVKEAGPSVLEPHAGGSVFRNSGKRVVCGQRLMQAASDLFLGWIRDAEARDYYVRQLRDMKGAVEIEELTGPDELASYGAVCGWALARAHARSGDPAAIAGYLGGGEPFDRAIEAFAADYADQTERDHEALVHAIRTGRIDAIEGV